MSVTVAVEPCGSYVPYIPSKSIVQNLLLFFEELSDLAGFGTFSSFNEHLPSMLDAANVDRVDRVASPNVVSIL